jgi:phosphatidylserine/phosphatidylglycerophosphate/cardiolipin synthase-like enzyme
MFIAQPKTIPMLIAKRFLRMHLLALLALALTACSSVQTKPGTLPADQRSADLTVRNYDYRTWYPPKTIPFDPIEVGKTLQAPIDEVHAKIIGPEYDDSVQSLATKLWLIENARYTVDMAYYIFKRDRVGNAVLGALCNAVKRGVDVRLTIDSGGSIHPTHSELKALQTCSNEGGQLRDASGKPTDRKARAQIVIVNALSKVFVRMNRRSHDKLLVVDGLSPEHTVLMTGGRNISVDYYGITENGEPDPSAYQDMEMLVRPGRGGNELHIGESGTLYYTLLFLNQGNKFLSAGKGTSAKLRREREKAQADLDFLKKLPAIQNAYRSMPQFLQSDLRPATVRLAHELGNLTNKNVITRNLDNMGTNSNSIRDIFRDALTNSRPDRIRIVSPYFFFAKYKARNGKAGFDGAAAVQKMLEDNPDSIFELITNSALTSDNFMAQSVIDMDTAPRLLLTPEMAERWRKGLRRGQIDRELVESAEWKQLVANPRIRIYETGRSDAVEFGGPVTYGKLHAKFLVFDDKGFVGTDNFDYRSRLFNNEFGLFYKSAPLSADLNAEFDKLKAKSYLWGSPEWLDARDKLMAQKGMKAATTRYQRFLYKFSRRSGLIWLF